MTNYLIKILLSDEADPLIVDLPELDLAQAEQFTADLRHEVELAREVDAPAVALTRADGPDIGLEPNRVLSIDLAEQDEQ